MKLDDAKLRDALSTIHAGPLPSADAATIIDVARFAASIDGRMDLKEMATVARLAKIIYTMSGQEAPSVPSTPATADWMQELGKKLTATSARELAFAAAYVTVLADGKVGADEGAFGGKLIGALRIAPARAKELTAIIERAVDD